jgi:hypothetical protein
VPAPTGDAFFTLATEIADGQRWQLLRAGGWEDFVERLAQTIADLSARRRQALMMLLFLLMENLIDPAEVQSWLDAHDTSVDEGVEEMIGWLRQLRRDRS